MVDGTGTWGIAVEGIRFQCSVSTYSSIFLPPFSCRKRKRCQKALRTPRGQSDVIFGFGEEAANLNADTIGIEIKEQVSGTQLNRLCKHQVD